MGDFIPHFLCFAMEVKKERKYPYLFKSAYKTFKVVIDGQLIVFKNHEYSTYDKELALKLREYSKTKGIIKEVPVLELIKGEKEKQKIISIEQVEEQIEEVKKKTYPCPECGKEFHDIEAREKHKIYKHPEYYLLPKAVKYIKQKDLQLKKEFSRKKTLKNKDKSKTI